MKLGEAIAALRSVKSVLPDQDCHILNEASLVVASHLRDDRTGLSVRGVNGAPDRADFGSSLWSLSEDLRPILTAKKDRRAGIPMMAAITTIFTDARNGKGRQNSVLMLGTFRVSTASDMLGCLLEDDDVRGHAIKALTRLKDHRFRTVVRRLLPGLTGWERAAARKSLRDPVCKAPRLL